VDKLFDSRSRYGITSRAGVEPGCPVVAEDFGRGADTFVVTREELISLVDEAVRLRS
jgi:hypothetical protein